MRGDYADLFEEAGRSYNVDPALLKAVAHVESRFNPKAKGPPTPYGRAEGMMQIIPSTARRLGVEDPYDPKQAIPGAAKLLSENLDRFDSVEDAVAAYHGGPNTRLWGPKTRKYKGLVMAQYEGGAPRDDELESLARGGGEARPSSVGGAQDEELIALARGVSAPGKRRDVSRSGKGAPLTKFDASGNLVASDTGASFTPAQAETYKVLFQGGLLDEKAPSGSERLPKMRRTAEDTFSRGEFYIDLDGVLRQEPSGDDAGPGIIEGFSRGVGDIPTSALSLIPGIKDSVLANRLLGDQAFYEAAKGNSLGAKVGRFAGQVVGTVPALLGGEAALGAAGVRAALGPAGNFLAGKAGGAVQEGAGVGAKTLSRLLQGSSLGARGGLEGAAASALVSSASDIPLKEQLGAGALIGGVLGPAGPAVTGGAGRLFGGKSAGGAGTLAEQQAVFDAAQSLPVPVPLTKGTISGSPEQQMIENALLRGGKGAEAARVMQEAAEKTQGALRGNVEAIGSRLGPAPESGAGGATVSNKLNRLFDEAKAGVDDAYRAAREASEGAYLPASERPVIGAQLREAVRDYDPEMIAPLVRTMDGFDGTGGTLTPRDLFEARTRIGILRGGADPILGGAAAKATRALDAYIEDALSADLIHGDPGAVKAWREAIGKRRDFGKLFEGDDLIEKLTERGVRGEGRTMVVSPEDAANYILGKADLGFVGKRDLSRDLVRLRKVLGKDSDEWGALRSEVFGRIARAGEGAPEGGVPTFSGQKFFKAWERAKTKDPEIVRTIFTPEERDLIDRFATIAQRATTPVRGGDNPSNTAVASVVIKKALDSLGAMTGAAVGSVAGPGGAAVGSRVGGAFDAFMRNIGGVAAAREATSGAPPIASLVSKPQNNLVGRAAVPAAVLTGSRLFQGQPSAPQP